MIKFEILIVNVKTTAFRNVTPRGCYFEKNVEDLFGPSSIHSEEGDCRFLRTVGANLPNYTTSDSDRPQFYTYRLVTNPFRPSTYYNTHRLLQQTTLNINLITHILVSNANTLFTPTPNRG